MNASKKNKIITKNILAAFILSALLFAGAGKVYSASDISGSLGATGFIGAMNPTLGTNNTGTTNTSGLGTSLSTGGTGGASNTAQTMTSNILASSGGICEGYVEEDATASDTTNTTAPVTVAPTASTPTNSSIFIDSGKNSGITATIAGTVGRSAAEIEALRVGASAINTTGAIGNGVPVIEQPGRLLTATEENLKTSKEILNTSKNILTRTGEILSYTKKIKSISRDTCKLIKDLWTKEFKIDPEVKAKAKVAFAKSYSEFVRFLSEGRKKANGQDGGSFLVTYSDYVQEAGQFGHRVYLKQLEGIAMDATLKAAITAGAEQRKQFENDPNAAYKARVTPTMSQKEVDDFLKNPPKDSKSYFDTLVELADPRNNIMGQTLIQMDEQRRIVEAQKEEAAKEWETFGGYPPVKTCDVDTGKCLITTSGGAIAAVDQEYSTTKIKQNATANDIADIPDIEPVKQVASDLKTSSVSSSGTVSGTTRGGTSVSGGWGLGNSDLPDYDFVNDLYESMNGPLEGGGSGGGTGGGGTSGGGGTTQPPASISSFTAGLREEIISEDNTPTGTFGTPLIWSGETASCVTGNDWVSFYEDGASKKGSIIPRFVAPSGGGIGSNIKIVHPSLFAISGKANNTVKQPVAVSFSENSTGSAYTFTETASFTPNTAGMSAASTIFLTINGVPFSASAGKTPEEIVRNIRDAISTQPLLQDMLNRGIDFRFGINPENPKQLLLSASKKSSVSVKEGKYTISCGKTGGTATSKSVTINFLGQ